MDSSGRQQLSEQACLAAEREFSDRDARKAHQGCYYEQALGTTPPRLTPTMKGKDSSDRPLEPNAQPLPVRVILPVLNEELNLPAALASVAWADEVFVIDSGKHRPHGRMRNQSRGDSCQFRYEQKVSERKRGRYKSKAAEPVDFFSRCR